MASEQQLLTPPCHNRPHFSGVGSQNIGGPSNLDTSAPVASSLKVAMRPKSTAHLDALLRKGAEQLKEEPGGSLAPRKSISRKTLRPCADVDAEGEGRKEKRGGGKEREERLEREAREETRHRETQRKCSKLGKQKKTQKVDEARQEPRFKSQQPSLWKQKGRRVVKMEEEGCLQHHVRVDELKGEKESEQVSKHCKVR